MRVRLSKILTVFLCLGMLFTLAGCNAQNTEEITEVVSEYLRACGNQDYGSATKYIDPAILNYDGNPSEDESGMVWVHIPKMVQEKMPDNYTADIEIRKYVGYGLKLMYGDAEIADIELKDDIATVILKGKGQLLHWVNIDTIEDEVSKATEEEFISDYNWYKEKIADKGQDIVFSDIRNKVTPKVLDKIKKDLSNQETMNYIKQVVLKKDKEGNWKITKITTHEDDGTQANWFGEEEEGKKK